MSGQRPKRDVKKCNYRQLHFSGTTNSDSEPEVDLDCENWDSDAGKKKLRLLDQAEILAEDTPQLTPNESYINSNISSPASVTVIPESLTGDNRSRSSVETNMVDNNLHDELTEAELEERNRIADEENANLEKKARLLAQQVEVEAKERQIVLMKCKIDELLQARQTANENPAVLNPSAVQCKVTRQQPTCSKFLRCCKMSRKRERGRKKDENRRKRQNVRLKKGKSEKQIERKRKRKRKKKKGKRERIRKEKKGKMR